MNKEEYIDSVMNQIRCKKAKDMIGEEIGNHIDDQTKAFLDIGMEEDKAMELAVKEMGDPVDTGVMLDRIHRPKMAWRVLILIGIISSVSLIIQFAISKQNALALTNFAFSHQLIFVIIGLASMLGIYFVDYSVIGKYAREIGFIFNIIIFINVFFVGITVNGATSYISIFSLKISMIMLMYLYVPIYGAILYQYRNESYKAIVKSFIWLIIPVFIALSMPRASLALNLFIVLLLILTVAVVKDWFAINKRITLSAIWGVVFTLPIIGLSIIMNDKQAIFTLYRINRIKALVHPDSSESGYQILHVRELLKGSKMIGINDSRIQAYQYLPDINSDYILTHVISYYGILAAVILMALMVLLINRIFKISFRQKNQLGMIMGLGCGLAYSIQVIIYVLQNLGLYPTTTVFLPLFSYGATGTIVSYILLGILLSIYRYQNIISTKIPKRKKIKLMLAKD